MTDCRYYPVILYKKGIEIKDYFYFHSTSCLRDFVEYSKSFFVVSSAGVYEQDVPPLNSYNDLKEFQKTLEGIKLVKAKQLFLKHDFPYHKPLFRTRAFEHNFFITKNLKAVMENNNITGLNIYPAKDLIKTPNLS